MEEKEESISEGIPKNKNQICIDSVAGLNSISNLMPMLPSMSQELSFRAKQAAMQNVLQPAGVMCDALQSAPAFQIPIQVTENVGLALSSLNEIYLEINRDAFEKMRDATHGLMKTSAFLRCCNETNWPIYWDCDRDFENEVVQIQLQYDDGIIDDIALKEMVSEAVLGYYDRSRVKVLGERWKGACLVNEGQQGLLAEAIERHIKGDYLASTALLACLSGGLTEKFYWHAFEAGLFSEEELSLIAEVHNVKKPSRKKATARAQVFSLGLCTEQGALYWDAACKYIADTMLTSGEDWEPLAEDNPLRNKICHGEQTNYGTEVHSLKAILVVDLLLRLGVIVEEAAAVAKTEE